MFEYLALVWALLFGFWIWGDTPNATVLLGAVLIIGSGIAIARMEGRRARALGKRGQGAPAEIAA